MWNRGTNCQGGPYVALLAYVFWAGLLSAQDAKAVLDKVDRRYFIENKGQWPSEVLYLARLGGMEVWITKWGVSYDFYRIEGERREPLRRWEGMEREAEGRRIGHVVHLRYQGAHPHPVPEGREKLSGYHNYFIGNDPSRHATNVGLYREVWVKGLYPGIDVRYYFDGGWVRYDYVVGAGVDVGQIAFAVEGVEGVRIDGGDDLVLRTVVGEVQIGEMRAFQGGKEVISCFERRGEVWGVKVVGYDRRQPLLIDPLVYSTYLGGSDQDEGHGIAVDGSGHAYVTGWTDSPDFDVTPGVYQTTNEGFWDVFVTKLSVDGGRLEYSTYLGGSARDQGYGIAVDGSGHAYVTGQTGSDDFDITPGAYQTTNEGFFDVFVTKLSVDGRRLEYSTYLGGSDWDEGYGIAVDGSGHAYVTGYTNSDDFDITSGAYQTTYGGGDLDVFVTKLSVDGRRLEYSTYLGGSDWDEGSGIAVDGSGHAYVTGYTNSDDFDITSGAYQTTFSGGTCDGVPCRDAFVTKLSVDGRRLEYSTYLGGSEEDWGHGIAVDGSGHAYVAGTTTSTDFDITSGAYQTTFSGGDCGGFPCRDVFVTKLSVNGQRLEYSTYLGGSSWDWGRGIAVDGSGHAYVTGWTGSTDFDVTSGAYQTTYGGGYTDVFVTKICLTSGITIWTGGAGTTAWNNANNWSGCPVPNSCSHNVSINSGPSNQPVIPAGETWTVRDITIPAGASLTVNGTLRVCGHLTVNGTLDGTGWIEFVGDASYPVQEIRGTLAGGPYIPNLRLQRATDGTVRLMTAVQTGNVDITSSVTHTLDFNGNVLYVSGDFTNQTMANTVQATGAGSTLVFNGSGAQTYSDPGSDPFLDVVVNQSAVSTVTLNHTLRITGSLTLTQGLLVAPAASSQEVRVENTAPTAVNAGNANSFVAGFLRRYLNNTGGSYDFPVGLASPQRYSRINFNFSGNPGVHNLLARFDAWTPPTPSGTPVDECGANYGTCPMLNNGYWTVNAYQSDLTTQITGTSGTYTATLYNTGYTACPGAVQFGVLKNTSASATTGTNWFIQNPDCHANASAATVSRPGMSGFSFFGTGQSTSSLPIVLVDFRGRVLPDGSHELSWVVNATAGSRVRHYVIEAGTEPGSLLPLVTLGPEETVYRRLSPPFGRSFYRLRIHGEDGSELYSSVVELERKPASTAENLDISVYPNPAREEVHVSWRTDGLDPIGIRLYNSLGQAVSEATIPQPQATGAYTFSLRQLSKGLYLLEVRQGERLSLVRLVVE